MTDPHRLSPQEARRIAVRAQLLDAARPVDLLDTVRRLTLLQYEPTAAVAPSADLVLWSRLGRLYRPEQLDRARRDHVVVELRSMIRAAHDVALYRAEMEAWPGADARGWHRRRGEWLRENDACRSGCGTEARCCRATCPTRAPSPGNPAAGTTGATSR